MSKDSFYTPTWLANKLIKYVDMKHVQSVADFCIGDGELLRAARARWPQALCYGTDLSQKAVVSVRNSHKDWHLSKCDFLNINSRNRCKTLQKIDSGIDLILLNPPFSCIGGTRHKVMFDGKAFDASTAMTFLVESLNYLSVKGSAYTILPNSVAYSEKDQKIWSAINSKYDLSILEESNDKHFNNCSPKVILVSIKQSPVRKRKKNSSRITTTLEGISLFRGKLGMHKVKNNPQAPHFLIHSTNLKNNSIEELSYKVNSELSKVSGPALLIPRVGHPNKNKLGIIAKGETFILSDCVIAIKTKTNVDANLLKVSFIKKWTEIEKLYKGTGAKYTTVERLKQYLRVK